MCFGDGGAGAMRDEAARQRAEQEAQQRATLPNVNLGAPGGDPNQLSGGVGSGAIDRSQIGSSNINSQSQANEQRRQQEDINRRECQGAGIANPATYNSARCKRWRTSQGI